MIFGICLFLGADELRFLVQFWRSQNSTKNLICLHRVLWLVLVGVALAALGLADSALAGWGPLFGRFFLLDLLDFWALEPPKTSKILL